LSEIAARTRGHKSSGARRLLAYGALALAPLLWSGNFVVGRAVHESMPPLGLAFWRWFVAFAAVLPFAAPSLWRQRALVRRHWAVLLVLGFSGAALYQTLIYFALQTTSAINTALIFTSTPVMIVLLSWLLHRERSRPLQLLGIAVAFAGAVAVVSHGSLATLRHFAFNRGDLYVLASNVLWAIYSVLLRRAPSFAGPVDFLAIISAVAVVTLLPLHLSEVLAGNAMPASWGTVVIALYIGLGASVGGFLCWNGGVAVVGANHSGLFLYLMPVYSAALAMLFLGEQVHAFHVVGIALIVGGILLATRRI
jgi:drug/metabolite transporter (DMT)-like permease